MSKSGWIAQLRAFCPNMTVQLSRFQDVADYGHVVGVFDTSIASKNLGDEIIMEAVTRHLRQMFGGAFFVRVATHEKMGDASYGVLASCRLAFVGGTNLLSSNMDKYNQWKITKYDSYRLKNVTLMGVGWWQYQGPPNPFTSALLKRDLSSKFLHSVRDQYTERRLNSIGIANVLNTGCITMWDLTPDHCAAIPAVRGSAVVTTLTDYNRQPDLDTQLLEVLSRTYGNVWLWLQGAGDYAYARTLSLPSKIQFVEPSLGAFDTLLTENRELDYVGTRLHAGIRSLHHGRRALIIAIDNRAAEIGRNFGLPILDRRSLGELEAV